MNVVNNIVLFASLPLCLAFVPALPYIAILIGVWVYRKRLLKWLNTDTCRDIIVPLGPKQVGKSELRDAIMGNPYDENRMGTTTATCGKYQLGEKWFVDIPDGGGDENIMKANRESLFDLIEKEGAEHVLLILTFDLQDLRKRGAVEVADDLKVYINMMSNGLKENESVLKSCPQGSWCYCVIGTHADMIEDEEMIKPEASRLYEQMKGKISEEFPYMKEASYRNVCFVDLKTDKGRTQAAGTVVDILKAMKNA